MTMNTDMRIPLMTKRPPNSLRTHLKEEPHSRKASLTDVEMAFLSALLIDDPPTKSNIETISEGAENENAHTSAPDRPESVPSVSRVLNNDILFHIPKDGVPLDGDDFWRKRPAMKTKSRGYQFLVGLWHAHEDGVLPNKLSSLHRRHAVTEALKGIPEETAENETGETAAQGKSAAAHTRAESADASSVPSDQEVRDESDKMSDISWDEDEVKQYDAWQVLKDEYASDFGFDFTSDGSFPADDDDLEPNVFKILGTSADDKTAHPHVLSPPLMDSIINFLPSRLRGQNLWMKYSLVRDGASLDTFKHYARASHDTVLAIETTKGHVFGCYTSQSWRTAPSFYGGAPSFVFKMRHSRNTHCYSLIEQAQMESEIDVYFLSEEGQRPQVCTRDTIGVGEGTLQKYDFHGVVTETNEEAELKQGKNYGFAIALEDDLLSGTTNKCSSYKNPCLVDPESNGEPFEVLNLELWTFTPCFSLDAAEKLEMTQFFVSESVRNLSMRSSISNQTERSLFSSQDLSREQFYRRLGQGDDHEELRERWQYRNMMDGGGVGGPRAIGASPRFNNSTT